MTHITGKSIGEERPLFHFPPLNELRHARAGLPINQIQARLGLEAVMLGYLAVTVQNMVVVQQ